MPENLKYFAWSYNKEYLNEIMVEIGKRGIECYRESYLKSYLLSVSEDSYQEALKIVREIGDENKMGSVNYYDEFRPLKAYSLAYAYLEDTASLNKSLEHELSKSKKIRKMIKQLKDICGCDIELIVNLEEAAIEVLTPENLNNTARIKEKICNFLRDNNHIKFKEVYVCSPEGAVMKLAPEEMLKIEGIHRLFDTSFLSYGMYDPERANLVSKENEEGHRSWKEDWGFTDDIKFIEEYSEDKVVIMGETTLYEDKFYNFAGEATSLASTNFLSFKTKLIDNLDYSSTIILSDNMVAKITTKYKDSRKVTSTRKLPFGDKFPNAKSTRDGFLPFPKESGEYQGTIEEYYMRSTDGIHLLHYATHSPYFEIFDIPTDFDFINKNEALKQKPKVYGIREYDPEDPEIAPVKDLLDKTVKKLELTTIDGNS